MPAKSAKQYRYMQLIAHSPEKSGTKGPSKELAKEFIKATPANKRKEFSKR